MAGPRSRRRTSRFDVLPGGEEPGVEEGDRGNGQGDEGLTGAAEVVVASIGARLRQARGDRYSITTLAQMANVSAGRISQIERGTANPSFATLWRLTKALDIAFGTFFDTDAEHTYPLQTLGHLVRKDERKRFSVPRDGLYYELLTPNTRGKLEVYVFTAPAHFDNSKAPLQHDGEELLYLMSGILTVHVGPEAHELREGDSITYDSSIPHYTRNLTDRPATAIGVVTPPSF
jgi:transcriptional regulator with XRE-family HTH domain